MIFISHSSKNEALARYWCKEIERFGIACWLSERDLSPERSNWADEITEAIKKSTKVLVLVTPDAVKPTRLENDDDPLQETRGMEFGGEVHNEISQASALGKNVIPLIPEAFEIPQYFMYLTRKYTDFSIGRLSLAVNAVIYTICALTMNVSVAIYSIIYSVFLNLTVDHIHEQNICTEMTIFTKKDPLQIVNFITSELHHSANYWEGISGYTGEKDYIIYTVISKYDAHKMDVFLKQYDEKVFAVKNNGVSLDGNFKKQL